MGNALGQVSSSRGSAGQSPLVLQSPALWFACAAPLQRLLHTLQSSIAAGTASHDSERNLGTSAAVRLLPRAKSSDSSLLLLFPAVHSAERFSSGDKHPLLCRVQAVSSKPLLGKPGLSIQELCHNHISLCCCPRHLHVPPETELFIYFSVTSELNSDLQALSTRSELLVEAHNCLTRQRWCPFPGL